MDHVKGVPLPVELALERGLASVPMVVTSALLAMSITETELDIRFST